MEYQGKEIDDRYGILSPFFEWADKEIDEVPDNHKLHLHDRYTNLGGRIALREAKEKLLGIVLQAERDADGNMAAASEAREN